MGEMIAVALQQIIGVNVEAYGCHVPAPAFEFGLGYVGHSQSLGTDGCPSRKGSIHVGIYHLNAATKEIFLLKDNQCRVRNHVNDMVRSQELSR